MTADMGTAPAPQPRKSGALKWVLLGGLGCLFLVLLGVGGCIGTVFWALNKAKDSAIYKESLAAVQQSPSAQTALGTPIEGGMPTQFNYNSTNGRETGTLTFTVTGPKGEGSVNMQGTASGGKWAFSILTLTAGGKTFDLLREEDEDVGAPGNAEQDHAGPSK